MFGRPFLIISAGLSLFVLGVLVWGLVSSKDEPPAEDGAALAIVVEPDLSPVAIEGRALFQEKCAVCHGDKAEGRNGAGPPLVHKIYEPGHHADGAFLLAATQGVRAHHWPFGDMPPVENVTGKEIETIVAYVRELQRANGIY